MAALNQRETYRRGNMPRPAEYPSSSHKQFSKKRRIGLAEDQNHAPNVLLMLLFLYYGETSTRDGVCNPVPNVLLVLLFLYSLTFSQNLNDVAALNHRETYRRGNMPRPAEGAKPPTHAGRGLQPRP
ncbi:hypothetical protein [Methyloglobulus sp.]|uniref:hypothetical protein n=1 Tax=Methyloglobulus sp. TaxID=2518622 RepID=UPI0032B73243